MLNNLLSTLDIGDWTTQSANTLLPTHRNWPLYQIYSWLRLDTAPELKSERSWTNVGSPNEENSPVSSLLGSNSQIRGPEYNRIQITFISPWPQTWVIKRLEMAWKCDKRETKVNLSLSGTKMWMKILRKMYKWDGKMLGIGIKQAIDGNVKLLLSFLEIFSETCGQRSQHCYLKIWTNYG